MTGRQRIQQLTAQWALYSIATSALTWLLNGMGLVALIGTAVATGIGLFLTYLVGQALENGSAVVRWLAIALSLLGLAFGALGVVHFVGAFFATFSIAMLGYALMSATGVWMNVRSLKTLFHPSVGRHCR